MDLRHVAACEQRHRRERLAGVAGTDHDADLFRFRQFGRAVHRLGGIALGIADDQFDLPPVDAAGGVDFVDRELNTAGDADAGR